MAVTDWVEIYRTYEPGELAAEIEQLKKDLRGGFGSQNSGGTGHTRDVAELRTRLQAASRVREEGRGGRQPRRGVVDFSGNGAEDW